MTADSIAPILQLGFAALMAYLIWRGYQEMTGTLVKVIKDNTEAMTGLKTVIDGHTRATERIGAVVDQLGHRVDRLEHDHDDETKGRVA